MKKIQYPLVILLSAALTSCAQDPAQVTFHVIDDVGNPVTNATVGASTFEQWLPGGTEAGKTEYNRKTGTTDTNGLVTITLHTKTGSWNYMVKSEGNYGDMHIALFGGKEFYYDRGGSVSFTNVLNGKWQPWNPTVEVVVKPVLNPIAMYAKRPNPGDNYICKTPELGKTFGFDLMEGDWVSPHGKGKVADFLIRVDSKPSTMPAGYYDRHPNAVRETDTTFTLSFANPDDGIQSVFADPLRGSALRLPRFAPETGYQTNYTSRYYVKNMRLVDETDRPDQNHFFRIRSKRNEKGKLGSALYGKIHGPIKYAHDGQIGFEYFLNPTPLDRNMEFDYQKNLFIKGVSPNN